MLDLHPAEREDLPEGSHVSALGHCGASSRLQRQQPAGKNGGGGGGGGGGTSGQIIGSLSVPKVLGRS